MDIIDFLLLEPSKRDYLDTMNCLLGEYEVYMAICMGIVIADDISIKINIQ